jgi:hypothetical protein
MIIALNLLFSLNIATSKINRTVLINIEENLNSDFSNGEGHNVFRDESPITFIDVDNLEHALSAPALRGRVH